MLSLHVLLLLEPASYDAELDLLGVLDGSVGSFGDLADPRSAQADLDRFAFALSVLSFTAFCSAPIHHMPDGNRGSDCRACRRGHAGEFADGHQA
jgi:hypothetical protein